MRPRTYTINQPCSYLSLMNLPSLRINRNSQTIEGEWTNLSKITGEVTKFPKFICKLDTCVPCRHVFAFREIKMLGWVGEGGNLSFWDLDISPATTRLVSFKILTSFKSGSYYSQLIHSSYNVKLRTLSSHVRVFMVCWCWSFWL